MTTFLTTPPNYPNGKAVLSASGINDTTETIILSADPGTAMSTSNFVVVIEHEHVLVASRSGATLTCTGGRGYAGTTAAAHAGGTPVVEELTSAHIQAILDWIAAYEADPPVGGGSANPEIVWALNDAQVGMTVFDEDASMFTDGTGPVKRLASDGTADQGAQWTGIVPEVTETAEWTLHGYLLPRASEADTTAVVYVIFQKGGGADFLTDAFDDENAVQIDIPATAGYPVAFEIPIVNRDGLVAGDLYRAQVWRKATADGTGGLTDNAEVLDIVGDLRVTFAEPEA